MKMTPRTTYMVLMVTFLVMLYGCAAPPPTPPPTEAVILAPTNTPRIFPTPTITPTRTASPTLRPSSTPLPTWTPVSSLTPRPTFTLTPAIIGLGEGELPFRDDFSDPLSGWPSGGACEGSYGYGETNYSMVNGQPYCPLCVSRQRFHTGAIIQVRVTKNSGADDAFFGLTCRKNGEANYFALVINGSGDYAIIRSLGAEETYLAEGNSGAIRKGNSTNRMTASCVESVISLQVNGVEVASVVDPYFTFGNFLGLILQTQEGTPVDVTFDDFDAVAP